jgi:hypothetical protein
MATSAQFDPGLRPYFYADGWLHHPLLMLPGADTRDAAWINEEYRTRKAFAVEAKRKGDWWQYIMTYEKPYQLKPLCRALSHVNAPAMAASLVELVWSASENMGQHLKAWRKIWQSLSDPRLTMDEEERQQFVILPDKLQIFRGWGAIQGRKRGAKGLSWTTSRAMAEWFACRFDVRPGYVASGWVDKKDVFAYLMGREESEIVVLPENVWDLIVTEYACTGGGNAAVLDNKHAVEQAI